MFYPNRSYSSKINRLPSIPQTASPEITITTHKKNLDNLLCNGRDLSPNS